ncbi:cytochrome c oxidase subunit II [Bacteroidota bacterium]|nr:cytochrome c oxidase subunit II [Bacteroidota bacterium]
MTTYLVIAALLLIGMLVVQISKANEYINTLRGEDAELDTDKINGVLWLIFTILFLVGIVWSTWYFSPLFLPESASEHGHWIDTMFNITLILTGIVFVLTQAALGWFAWKYHGKKGKLGFYYPENNKLEMIWTVVPAIALTILVVVGLYYWFRITGPASADARVVEITGKQFNWLVRYPGPDGKLGTNNWKLIDETNAVGIDFNNKDGLDDVMPTELHFEVNKPYLLKIGARDVIHDVGLPHFRIHMDAMPGLPTHFKFTPTITTDEMKKKTNNPNFDYELCCDYLCGKGHSAMKMMVYVDTKEQYQAWLQKQKSFYETAIKGTDEEKKFKVAATGTVSTESGNTQTNL